MTSETTWADDLVKHPEKIDEIRAKYCLLCDRSVSGGKFDNLNRAINLMAERGWRCIGVTGSGTAVSLYALMERL